MRNIFQVYPFELSKGFKVLAYFCEKKSIEMKLKKWQILAVYFFDPQPCGRLTPYPQFNPHTQISAIFSIFYHTCGT
jgi:hypothetical protein